MRNLEKGTISFESWTVSSPQGTALWTKQSLTRAMVYRRSEASFQHAKKTEIVVPTLQGLHTGDDIGIDSDIMYLEEKTGIYLRLPTFIWSIYL